MKKNMKRILFLLAVTITFQLSAFAQVDPKAKVVLDAVSANLKSLKSMRASFTLAVSKTKEKRSGTISMKGLKYYINAGAQEIFCDAKTIYTYQKSAKEVTINDLDPNENTLSPSKLFTNFYDKEYKSRFVSEKKVGAITQAVIELIPLKVKQFIKVELTVDRTKNIIISGRIFEKNGNVMTYNVANFVANAVLADNIFVWNIKKYPGTAIVDLR
jgi:outer membrane lipoprotein carrier protein